MTKHDYTTAVVAGVGTLIILAGVVFALVRAG